MTHAEAVALFGSSSIEDVADSIEMALFKAKQELIQKVDQILLFPAKEKKWKLLHEAAHFLGYESKDEVNYNVAQLNTLTIESAFNSFQQNRSSLLNQLSDINSFEGLNTIQQLLHENYLQWARFWTSDLTVSVQEDVKKSNILDSMRFLQWIIEIKKEGIDQVDLLNEGAIPADVLHEIRRLKLIVK
jgi:hypothetical protein